MLQHFKEILLRNLQALHLEVSSFKDESKLWETLPGTTNSAGHLALHLVGNLNHFIGAGFGKSGYIRKRDEEFGCSPIPREILLKEIDDCKNVVDLSFAGVTDEDLGKDFPLPWREGLFYNTHFMLVQLTTHFSYHLGQINYNRRYFNA